MTYFLRFSLIKKTAEQTSRVIPNICSCIPERNVRIVSKVQDASILEIVRKEVSEPESLSLCICPGLDRISVETMNSNDTG